MQRLFDVLMAAGATGLTGRQLYTAQGISADGRWIVGYASGPVAAWKPASRSCRLRPFRYLPPPGYCSPASPDSAG